MERTKSELRGHITAIQARKVDFQTAAFAVFQEGSTRARVCQWEITYSPKLAKEWLERQEEYIRKGIVEWRQKEKPPENTEIKRRLIEYLAYDPPPATN